MKRVKVFVTLEKKFWLTIYHSVGFDLLILTLEFHSLANNKLAKNKELQFLQVP